MKIKSFSGILILCVGIILLLSACGKKEAPISVQDTQPFKSAIQDYLKSKNYGMDVSSFDELGVSGDTGSAICKMQEAENLYNLKVTWQFSFEKKDGKWTVKNHAVK